MKPEVLGNRCLIVRQVDGKITTYNTGASFGVPYSSRFRLADRLQVFRLRGHRILRVYDGLSDDAADQLTAKVFDMGDKTTLRELDGLCLN